MPISRTPRSGTVAFAAILAAVAVSALAPRSANAQSGVDAPKDYPPCTKKASPADLDAAKGAHKAASEFNERGDYDKAIQYWRDAYTFDCTAHGLLINIANAYEKKGDKASAILALETYQTRTGGAAPNAATISEKIVKLKASLVVAPQPTTTATTAPPPPSAGAAEPPPPPQPASGERPFGIAPWFVVGGGGVLVIVGAILLPVGLGAVSSADTTCPDHSNCSDAGAISQGNTGRTETGLGATFLGVGAAAVGGGLAWQFLGNQPGPAKAGALPAALRAVRVEPSIAPGRSGLALSGKF